MPVTHEKRGRALAGMSGDDLSLLRGDRTCGLLTLGAAAVRRNAGA
jgi:hypothetical protein